MKVLSVVGNRPQFVKSGPLSVALREEGIDEVVLHTGQHYDRELSDVFFAELGLAEPMYQLEAHTRDVEAMQPGIVAAMAAERPGRGGRLRRHELDRRGRACSERDGHPASPCRGGDALGRSDDAGGAQPHRGRRRR